MCRENIARCCRRQNRIYVSPLLRDLQYRVVVIRRIIMFDAFASLEDFPDTCIILPDRESFSTKECHGFHRIGISEIPIFPGNRFPRCGLRARSPAILRLERTAGTEAGSHEHSCLYVIKLTADDILQMTIAEIFRLALAEEFRRQAERETQLLRARL